MTPSILDSAVWGRGLTLTERLSELRRLRTKTGLPANPTLAGETLTLWRASSPLDQDSYFAQRLALDGITEEEFTQILGTPAENLNGKGDVPAWTERIAAAYSPIPKSGAGEREKWSDGGNNPASAFLNLVEPLILEARRTLQSNLTSLKQRHPDAPLDVAQAADALFANLPPQILTIIGKTMVLELNVARLEGKLTGATPAERFASFTERLSRREIAMGILSEYPVLARRVVACIDNWVRFSTEFAEHLAADWKQIATIFGIDPQSALVEAAAGAGDTHRHGRSVILARFEDGSKLVYKPRSLAVDRHFQDFIRWVNAQGANPQLRALQVLDSGNHGWIEFVHAKGCASSEEVVCFYERQGEYLAILYVLAATDFHFENLLACGEHPVLVDLEALFHPWVRGTDIEQPDVRLVALAKARSVLRTGLLPRRTGAHDDYTGIDLSGLGGAAGQLTDNVLQWAAIGTDEMAAVKQPLLMPAAQNRPDIDGVDVDVREYTESIISGFCRMYDLLRSHRAELLADSGPLEQFAEDEVRMVARATRGYGVLRGQSYHPDYLRDGLDRDRLLDRLWTGVDENAHLLRFIHGERRDLLEGDIPIFTTHPASSDVFTSDGQRVEAFFEKTGMELSRALIENLSDEDRRRQVWFIGASMATLDLGAEQMKWAKYQPVWTPSPCSLSQLRPLLIEEACRIGDRLEELSLQDGPHVAWIGFAYVNRIWSLDSLLEDLYAGSAGLILTLAYLGSFGFDQYSDLARRALATLRLRLDDRGREISSIGAFNGWGGIIYLLSHLGALWNDPELFSYALRLVDRLPDLIEKDDALDLVGGCAGCIGGLLSLYQVAPSNKVLAACVQCGDRLLAKAQPMQAGHGWFINVKTTIPITGFAHGAAGIGWALLELAARTGNEKYRAAAIEGMLYESSQYSPEARNWADNAGGAELGSRNGFGPSMAWCYGAPGIGMARAAALKHIDHPVVAQDLERALEATISQGPGTNHSLCHGDLGNLDFLLQAAAATGSAELAQTVDKLANQIVASMKKYGWLCGVPLGVESPALMNGLAGLCYGLLRLADPEHVPSVLTLSPPRI
jgi:type 2 lantibiotic biosynthesis protein LanM